MSCDSLKSLLQNDHLHEEEKLPKSFLQLKGILIGNYNMAWNFHISSAIRIMIQHNLAILAIQEHTAWSRTLTEHKISSIERHCNKWEYFVTISKLQIFITDKQLLACYCGTKIEKEGRIISSRFQVSVKQFVTFISVYGIPHLGHEKSQPEYTFIEENT